MAKEVKGKVAAEGKEAAEINFKCKLCGETKPLSEMTVVIGLFPRVIACRDCERKMR